MKIKFSKSLKTFKAYRFAKVASGISWKPKYNFPARKRSVPMHSGVYTKAVFREGILRLFLSFSPTDTTRNGFTSPETNSKVYHLDPGSGKTDWNDRILYSFRPIFYPSLLKRILDIDPINSVQFPTKEFVGSESTRRRIMISETMFQKLSAKQLKNLDISG